MKDENLTLEVVSDDNIERTGPSGSGEFYYVDISSVHRDSKDITTPKLLPVEKAPSRAKQVLKTGDVLVSMTRPNLNAVALVPKHLDGAIGSTGFHVNRAKHADPHFIFLAVQSREFVDAMCKKVQGALYPAVRPTDISSFILPPFSLAHQRRIVTKIEKLFSELDAGEESFKQAQKQLGIYRQSLLKQAFEGKLTEAWRKANPDQLEDPEKLLARIQQERESRHQQQLTDWQQAVEQWEQNGKEGKKPAKPRKLKPFDTLANEIKPSEINGWFHIVLSPLIDEPAYGTSKKCAANINGTGVLRIPNVVGGYINPDDLKFAQFDESEMFSLGLLKNDLLMIRSNGSISIVGRCAQIRERDTKFLYAGYLIRLRPNETLIESPYLKLQLGSHGLRVQIENAAKSTSGVNNINAKEIQSLKINLCSLPEQQEIVRLLEAQFTVIEQNEREIDAALKRSAALRQSILKRAFSGQLVPQDPTDEPASVLLERIQQERTEQQAAAKATKKAKKKTAKKKTASKRAKKSTTNKR